MYKAVASQGVVNIDAKGIRQSERSLNLTKPMKIMLFVALTLVNYQ